MDNATLGFSAFGLVGLVIVGRQIAILYMAAKQVFENHVRCVLSAFVACFFMLFGLLLAGLSLSFVLTKSWPLVAHFMLLACLCAVSGFLQLIPAKKRAKAVAQAKVTVAPARVEPTVDPVTQATPAVAPASAVQSTSAAPVVAASAVAATAAVVAAASQVDEASLPDVPAPAVISGVTDADLDAWTPDEDEVAAPTAQPVAAEAAVASEVIASAAVPEMKAPADIEELASAVKPAIPATADSSVIDEPADVLELSGVAKLSDAADVVNAEHRAVAVEPASDNEVARPVVASSSEASVAVA